MLLEVAETEYLLLHDCKKRNVKADFCHHKTFQKSFERCPIECPSCLGSIVLTVTTTYPVTKFLGLLLYYFTGYQVPGRMKKVQHFNPKFNPKFVTFLRIENEEQQKSTTRTYQLSRDFYRIISIVCHLFYFLPLQHQAFTG